MKNMLSRSLRNVSRLAFAGALLLSAGGADAQNTGGTALTINGTPSAKTTCNGQNVTIELQFEVKTTGSVDSAEVTLETLRTVDGDDQANVSALGTIYPADFVKRAGEDRNAKFASFQGAITIAAGEYESIEVCATQSGAKGRESKRACATLNIDTLCDGQNDRCAENKFFGNLLENTELNNCKNVPVNFAGTPGTAPINLFVNGELNVALSNQDNGKSCNYHVKWSAPSDTPANTYFELSVCFLDAESCGAGDEKDRITIKCK